MFRICLERTVFLTVFLAGSLIVGPLASLRAESKPEQAAQSAAAKWLDLIDEGRYGQSWDEAAELFKARVPRDKWEAMVASVREPLGKLQSRTLKSAQHKTELPGVPDGQYVVLRYETSYENKKSAVETVTPMLEKDGTWKVSGYFIK